MNTRQEELANLKVYLNNIDKEITMILQNLQWDHNQLLQGFPVVTCIYNKNHKIPSDKVKKHEEKCFLKCQGYAITDHMLPEPLDINSNGLVKLSSENIQQIISAAAQHDYKFKKGQECTGKEPLTLERLQETYTADERRAIHDAVVNAAPSCHDLSELALPSGAAEEGEKSSKSRLEVLAELRDMKRRRTKYRVPARSRNYSDVLRTVITTQMELYGEALEKTNKQNPLDTNDMRERTRHIESTDRNQNENCLVECSGDYQSGRRKTDYEDKYQRRDSSRKETSNIRMSEKLDHESDKSYKWRDKMYEKKSGEQSHHRKYSYTERDRHRSNNEERDRHRSYNEERHNYRSHNEKRDRHRSYNEERHSDKHERYKSSREEKRNSSAKGRDNISHRSHNKEEACRKNITDNSSSNGKERNRDEMDEKHTKRHRYETVSFYESKAKYKREY